MSQSGDIAPELAWVFDVLEEHLSVPLACLYYDPGRMFNLQGVSQPSKEELDRFVSENLTTGKLGLVSGNGETVPDWQQTVKDATYLEPKRRIRAIRIYLRKNEGLVLGLISNRDSAEKKGPGTNAVIP